MAAKKAKRELKDRGLDRHRMESVVFRATKEEMAEFRAAAEESKEHEYKLAKWLRAAAHEKLRRQR
jgi:hypothetical protein